MSVRDAISVCTELKEAGASPEVVCAAALANGLERLETIRLLRSLFGLTLAGAKELIDGPSESAGRPHIETREQLLEILTAELGYCDCASNDALALLARFLRAARTRSDASKDSDEFTSASREVEACLPLDDVPGLAHWFVYALDQRGLVEHNFRVTDVWITPKGRWLLEAIERTRSSEPG